MVSPQRRDEITRRALEELARVPSYIWDGRSLPVPIDAIADSHYGLSVVETTRLEFAPGVPTLAPDAKFSGLLLPDRGEIWIDRDEAEQWPFRRRFTIAHELGHHVLHLSDDRTVHCRNGDVADPGLRGVPRPVKDPIESEANFFAAAMLMPPPLMREQRRRLDDDLHALAHVFQCSQSAMSPRLDYLASFQSRPGETSWHDAG